MYVLRYNNITIVAWMSAMTEILETVCNVWVYAPYNHCSMYPLSIAIYWSNDFDSKR